MGNINRASAELFSAKHRRNRAITAIMGAMLAAMTLTGCDGNTQWPSDANGMTNQGTADRGARRISALQRLTEMSP